MFRDLIPLLADRYHLVAPDFPGFGQSDLPDRSSTSTTFAGLAETIADFTRSARSQEVCHLYLRLWLSVGLRMALKFPDRISAIIPKMETPTRKG